MPSGIAYWVSGIDQVKVQVKVKPVRLLFHEQREIKQHSRTVPSDSEGLSDVRIKCRESYGLRGEGFRAPETIRRPKGIKIRTLPRRGFS